VICGPIGCAVDFVCRLLHLKIISLKNPLQIGLCNKAYLKWNCGGLVGLCPVFGTDCIDCDRLLGSHLSMEKNALTSL
ncbi:hypothetical protein KTI25_02240, partial [Acinetobacter ursingii]|nr:hypothetical protein [Acinetobacter ursingii]MCU4505383.1 hypothetical protein [Acinetobacter ursingii]